MQSDSRAFAQLLTNEIVGRDCYRIRRLREQRGAGAVATIIDVGANFGFFSAYARDLFPNARIVAFEPNPKTYAGLQANMQGRNVECFLLALGDGSPVQLVDRAADTVSGSKVAQAAQDGTPSMGLRELCGVANVDLTKPYLLKIDCEGGERFIFGRDEDILAGSEQWAMEVHYGKEFWPDTPTKEQYQAWWVEQAALAPNRTYEARWKHPRLTTVVSTRRRE